MDHSGEIISGSYDDLGPTQALQPQKLSKGDLFRVLNESIPLNEYHIPEYVYRADLIPQNYGEYPQKYKQQLLEAAAMPITFDHGYPALGETTPFWEQMPAEGHEAYNAFMVYLELPEKSNHDNPIRLLPMISQIIKRPLSEIVDWCHTFYWHYRSRAYDLFLIACHRKQREQRLMSIEGHHFKMAETFLNKINDIVVHKLDAAIMEIKSPNDDGTGELQELRTKELVDMVEKLVKIQRISVGLPANGTTQIISEGPRHGTINDHLKAVAKDSAGEVSSTPRPPEMDKLLESTEDILLIQDLIVKHQENSKSQPQPRHT